MSTPVNFNAASLEELKTLLTKTKAHAVLEACKKAGGHLSIKAFHTAAKLTAVAYEKMINDLVIMYEVDTSPPTPAQDTPPTSEDPSPIQTGEEVPVPGPTATGFELTPAKLNFTPSGLPYTDTQGGGPTPSNGTTGDHLPGHLKNEPPLRWVEHQSLPQKESPLRVRPQLNGNQPVPKSPKPDHQLKALQGELARMREELEAKKFENINFQEKLSTTEHQLASSQGKPLGSNNSWEKPSRLLQNLLKRPKNTNGLSGRLRINLSRNWSGSKVKLSIIRGKPKNLKSWLNLSERKTKSWTSKCFKPRMKQSG